MSQQFSGVKPSSKNRTLQELIAAEQVISYPGEVQLPGNSVIGESLTPRKMTGGGDRLANLVRLMFTTLGWLILLRILFKFIAAQPGQPIARFVYEFTESFVAPFYGLVTNETFDGGSNIKNIVEFSSMVAIVAYIIAGGIAAQFIRVLFGKPKSR
ncbi:MAG TPA: YggT family protein [Phototrophicaceae bacterium]|jgi:uncharacterized protein YggT (Ycf19 family)|nr:YggT family protein [Phototrophicaceae bacterium]